MTSTNSPLVTIITLMIGLILGLVIGFLIWRRGSSGTSINSTDLTEQLSAARAERDLYKSERDNAVAGSKLAGELEAMKGAMEKLQKEAGDADRRRIEAESDIRAQVRAMSTHNESLVAQTKAIAGALTNAATRGKFGEAQLELMLENAGLRKDIEYTAQRSTTDADSSGIPDITVKMPGGTKLFIDSKFPLIVLSKRMKKKIAMRVRLSLLSTVKISSTMYRRWQSVAITPHKIRQILSFSLSPLNLYLPRLFALIHSS